jgi:hypothetical protein
MKIISLSLMLSFMISISPVCGQENQIEFFTKIRMEYAKRDDFTPYWIVDPQRHRITQLWDAGKEEEAMELAAHWLEKTPVDGQMHGWYAFFLKKHGKYKEALKHQYIQSGLIASVTSSGSGLSPESPWKVISTSEEYEVLRRLGAELIKQSLDETAASGKPCDFMKCKIENKEITFYFDVSIPMEATPKLLNK